MAGGIAVEGSYSQLMGYIKASASERMLALLENLGFDLFANELLHVDSDGELIVLKGLEEFREHLGGSLTITLLSEIGCGFEVHDIQISKVIDAIDTLKQRHANRVQKQPETLQNYAAS